jgi:DnaA-homolog protein
VAGERAPLYLHGPADTGKSHLLLAACTAAGQRGATAHYVALGETGGALAQALVGAEEAALVCLDDLEAIAGDTPAELAVFAFYDRARTAGTPLLMAGRAPPAGLGLMRPELASRLAWGELCRLEPLDEAGTREVLRRRAAALGLELPDAVAGWLLRRTPRGLGTQLALIAQLDRAALAAQRRLTVPFVRRVLAGEVGEGASR